MPLIALFFLILSLLPSQYLAAQWKSGDACPRSIRTTVPDGPDYTVYREKPPSDRPPELTTMKSVHEALLQCPNLTSLDLRVTLLGCSEWPDRWNFPFALSGGQIYPSLEEIRLEGYAFDEREWEKLEVKNAPEYGMSWPEKVLHWWQSGKMQKYLGYRNLEKEQREKTNLALWADAMDWGSVEVLGLRECRGQHLFLESMASRLRSLKSLEIWDRWSGSNNTMNFIQSLEPNSLTNLTWREGWTSDVLPTVLQHHGISIQNLEIRTGERSSGMNPSFNASQLHHLVHFAPNLQHLSINVHRNGSWPYDVFEMIADMRRLKSVDMWFDILSDCSREKPERYSQMYDEWELAQENSTFKCEGENLYQRPFVDEQSALEMFKFMRERNTSGELKEVIFWVGDWSREWDGPLYLGSFLDRRRAQVVCTLEGKSEGEAWCVVEEGKWYWTRTGRDSWDY
jgi:hypothetical protein